MATTSLRGKRRGASSGLRGATFCFPCVCVPVVLATPQGKTAGQLPDESHGPAFSKKQLTGEATNYLLLGGSGANDGPSPQQRQTQAKLCQGGLFWSAAALPRLSTKQPNLKPLLAFRLRLLSEVSPAAFFG